VLIELICRSVIIIVFFTVIWWIYKTNTRKQVEKLIESIEKVSKGEELDDVPSKTLKPIYDALESLGIHHKDQIRIKESIFKIVKTLSVNIQLEGLLEDLIPRIIEGTRSNWGAFYVVNSATNKLEIKSSLGFTKNVYKEFDISIGEGFMGQAAKDKKIQIIRDIPDDTIYIGKTFMGTIKPKAIMIVPICAQHELVGTLVLASVYDYGEEQIEVIRSVGYYLGMAIHNTMTYGRIEKTLKELQFQNQLIQNMNNELEEKIKEASELLNTIVNNIEDYAIVSMDNRGFITLINEQTSNLLGFTKDEMKGRYFPEYLENPEIIKEELKEIIRRGDYREGKLSIKDKENKYHHVMVKANMVTDIKGKVKEILLYIKPEI